MKRFCSSIVLLGAFCLGLLSCENDDDVNFHFAALQVVAVDVPESFELNEQYEIKVTYARPDDCTFFEGFDIIQQDTTARDIFVVGSVITDRDCTELEEAVEATFNFVVLHNRPYTFRFWQGENEDGTPRYLEREVPIEESVQ